MDEKTRKEIFDVFDIYPYQQITDEELENVDWEEGYRFGNWRNYIYKYQQKEWKTFSILKKLLMYCKAVTEADKENDCY